MSYHRNTTPIKPGKSAFVCCSPLHIFPRLPLTKAAIPYDAGLAFCMVASFKSPGWREGSILLSHRREASSYLRALSVCLMDKFQPPAIPPPQWRNIWEERGWNQAVKPDIQDAMDPRGEAAYQKCFEQALSDDRVPNPSFFTNSPSAQEYIRNRDRKIFSRSTLDPQQKLPNPNFKGAARSPESNPSLTNTHSPASSGGHDPTSPLEERSKAQQATQPNSAGERAWPNQPSLSRPLEPQVGPIGPPRMLR